MEFAICLSVLFLHKAGIEFFDIYGNPRDNGVYIVCGGGNTLIA